MTTGFQATERAVLRVSGADSEKFLQDLVTNDVKRAAEGLVYAALLTPQGKYLADFFLLRDGEGFLLDVDAGAAPAVAQRLGMYKLRAAVEIAATDVQVFVITDGEAGHADPRDPALGRRFYGTEPPEMAAGDPEAHEATRIARVVPAHGAELVANDSYILECGFDRLDGVDFRKGCYVGQEVTARMKHKTELRKGLAGVQFAAPGVVPGTEITRDGKVVGKVTSVVGQDGIAYLRFDRAGDGMQAGGIAVEERPLS